MHTISLLRRTLGLSSDNQVRNRIERIKDLLSEHIRRGPNNQIFLTDPGLDLMRQFQELYDSGLTLAEASNVLRASSYHKSLSHDAVSSRSVQNTTKPNHQATEGISPLQEELALVRKQLAALEVQRSSLPDGAPTSAAAQPWWSYLREDVDVT